MAPLLISRDVVTFLNANGPIKLALGEMFGMQPYLNPFQGQTLEVLQPTGPLWKHP